VGDVAAPGAGTEAPGGGPAGDAAGTRRVAVLAPPEADAEGGTGGGWPADSAGGAAGMRRVAESAFPEADAEGGTGGGDPAGEAAGIRRVSGAATPGDGGGAAGRRAGGGGPNRSEATRAEGASAPVFWNGRLVTGAVGSAPPVAAAAGGPAGWPSRETVNITFPKCSRTPEVSRTGDFAGWSLTRVPYRLPRSWTNQPPSWKTSSACRRDTVLSWTRRSHPDFRPTLRALPAGSAAYRWLDDCRTIFMDA
jgi:hypothetical protein